MPGKYAKLKKEWLLRGWSDFPWVLVNWATGDHRELQKKGFYVAEACDGKTDFNSFAFLPSHHVLLDSLITKGIVELCNGSDSIDLYQQYRKAENPRLSGLHWSVTGLCNLNCRHCYMEGSSGRYGELPFEDMLWIIEQFKKANVQKVSLTGGEPFVRKDLLDIIAMLAKKKIWISAIFTNGLLITEEILRKIKKLGFSPSFQISFDGGGAHEHMRGQKGIEPGVIASIRMVRSAGFRVVISTSIDQTNKDCMQNTYNLLKSLGIQFWRITPPREAGNWRMSTTKVSFEEESEIYAPLLKQWLADSRPFDIQLGSFLTREGMNALGVQKVARGHITRESYDCNACRETPYLLPDGALLPCAGYTDTVLHAQMPNIFQTGLPKALQDLFLRSIIDMKKKDLLLRNIDCDNCDSFEECGMGCRAAAVEKTGGLLSKDDLTCEMIKRGFKKQFQALYSAETDNF